MDQNDRKLKILYLITKAQYGGAQGYVYDLATHADKAGHDVLVGFGGTGLLKERLEKAKIRTHEISSLYRDISFKDDVRGFFELIRLMKNEVPDIVHLNSSKMGGLGALAARIVNARTHVTNLVGVKRSPIRIIFTGHGWAFTEERADWHRALIAASHWMTIRLAHVTIAVSKRTKEEVARIPFTRNKLSVIYNGRDPVPTLERSEALGKLFGKRSARALPSEAVIIGTIGELHRNKGHQYALLALEQIKKQNKIPFRFIVIGEGEERENLELIRDSLGLTDEVIFAGWKSAPELLSAFDIFLFSSIKEGFPYAILEAGNAGLPVVATAVGGIPEVIDDMKSGILIQAKNPGEIARALSYLMEQPERRTEFGRAIRERIRGRFNVETMAEKTFMLYQSPDAPLSSTT